MLFLRDHADGVHIMLADHAEGDMTVAVGDDLMVIRVSADAVVSDATTFDTDTVSFDATTHTFDEAA